MAWMRWSSWAIVALVVGVSTAAYLGHVPIAFYRVPYLDKAMHFLLFGSLAFAFVVRFGDRRLPWPRAPLPLAVLAPGSLAAVEEALQSLARHRASSVYDLAADLAGMVFFWWLARRVWKQAAAC